jgi:MFS family permease
MAHAAGGAPAAVLLLPLLAVFVAALDLTVISTLLPGIIFDLAIPFTELDRAAWVVTAYLLAYTVAIPLLGRLSDRAGRWAIFLGALALFAAGSLWCARAGDLGGLIAGRVVQALGGGAMVPVTMALSADLLPPGRRATALGLVAAVDTAGWVAGPLYGAAVVGLLGGWQWVFWVNLPLVALTAGAVALAWRRSGGRRPLPRSPAPRLLGALDWPGAVLLAAALVGINLGLSLGAEPLSPASTLDATAAASPLAPYRWWLLGAGALALLAFVAVERRAADPLVPIGLWRAPGFAAASLVNCLLGGALIVAMVNVPVFVNTLAPDLPTAQWQSALLLTPLTGGMAAGSFAGGWLSGRLGPRWVAGGGLVLAALALGRMGTWPARLDLPAMAALLLALGLGFGLVIAPAASAAIDSAGRGDYGVASALVLVLRLLGMAVGLSALTAWALAELQERLAALPRPAPAAGETAAAYTTRLAAELAARAIEIALRVLGETFWIAGGICLLALLPAWWLGARGRSRP